MARTRIMICIATLVVFLLVFGSYASAQSAQLECSIASFSPEVITYYGDSSAVMDKLDNAQISMEQRRAYMLLIETKDSAELSFFERHGKDITVRHWTGNSAGDFREVAANLIMENRGIACIGEQLKHVVLRQFNPENLGDIPAPVTLRAAFGHAIQQHGKRYMRVTVFWMC